jgi:hypothetical protein
MIFSYLAHFSSTSPHFVFPIALIVSVLLLGADLSTQMAPSSSIIVSSRMSLSSRSLVAAAAFEASLVLFPVFSTSERIHPIVVQSG